MNGKNPVYDNMLSEWIALRSNNSQMESAKKLKETHGLPMTVGTIRVKMIDREKRSQQAVNESQDSTSKTISYEEIKKGDNRLDEYCQEKGIPISWVDSAKWVNHNGQEEFNIVLKKPVEGLDEIDFESIIAKYEIPQTLHVKKSFPSEHLFDRLVYTDSHVGMDPNPNNNSLYPSKWDAEELIDRCDQIIDHVIQNQKSEILVIDDLGDFADGWSGQTARGGHALPQNMTNEEVFDCGLEFKIRMVSKLSHHYNKIICHNICNSNHSGNGFDYVINSAFKKLTEAMFDSVEVINYKKFIQYYEIKGYYFIVTHGKDDKNMKFGFKPVLDGVQEKKIVNYIERSKIPRGVKLEFSKGDSHQYIFDNATSDLFNYYNYPALSPSSDWVKTNFQYGKSGAVFFNYRENGKTISDLIF